MIEGSSPFQSMQQQPPQLLNLVKQHSNVNKSRDHLNDGDGIIPNHKLRKSMPIMKRSLAGSPKFDSKTHQSAQLSEFASNAGKGENLFAVMGQPFQDSAKINNCFGASRSANNDERDSDDGAPCFKQLSAAQKQEPVAQKPMRSGSFADIALLQQKSQQPNQLEQLSQSKQSEKSQPK
jgi:hypothetical protein